MKEMKHLRTFESFSSEVINEEEILGIFKGKMSKVIDTFKEDNKSEFEKLKSLEKVGGKALESIQKSLMSKLDGFRKTLISDMKSGSPQMRALAVDNLNDISVIYKELSDTIKNVDPHDTSSTLKKMSRGSSKGWS